MVVKEFFKTREDGVDLFKNYSDKNFYIKQDQTGNEYAEAIDVENAPYTYTETDKTIDEDIIQEAKEFNYLTEQDSNIKNKVLNIYTDIEDWKNPKDTGTPYNKSDKCYYKERFWVSTIDNNISEPGSLTNTWINI